jgi:hypothetical protein
MERSHNEANIARTSTPPCVHELGIGSHRVRFALAQRPPALKRRLVNNGGPRLQKLLHQVVVYGHLGESDSFFAPRVFSIATTRQSKVSVPFVLSDASYTFPATSSHPDVNSSRQAAEATSAKYDQPIPMRIETITFDSVDCS